MPGKDPLLAKPTWIGFVAFGIFALLAANVGALSLVRTEASVRRQQLERLRAGVENTHRSVRQGWLEPLQIDLRALVSSDSFRTGVASLTSENEAEHHRTADHGIVETSLKMFAAGHAVRELIVVSPNGKLLHPHEDDLSHSATELRTRQPAGWERLVAGKPTIVSDAQTRNETGDTDYAVFISAPVMDRAGAVIAVVVASTDLLRVVGQVTRIGRMGETGETYAFDESGLMLSSSRFEADLPALGLGGGDSARRLNVSDPQVNLYESSSELPISERPLTYAVQEALKKRIGSSVEAYRDYRGVPVLGAWEWDSELNFGVVTEIDEAEALIPYRETRSTIVASLLVVLSLTATLMWLVRRLERGMRERLHEKDRENVAARVELERRFEMQSSALIRSEQRTKTILNKLTDGVISIDAKGTVTAFSNAASEIFGYDASEVIGRNINMLMPPETARAHGSFISQYLKTNEPRILRRPREVVGRRKNGGGFPMELAVGEARFGDEIIFTGIIRDLSRRHVDERRVGQLRRQVDFLKDELRRLTATDRGSDEAATRDLESTTAPNAANTNADEQRVADDVSSQVSPESRTTTRTVRSNEDEPLAGNGRR